MGTPNLRGKLHLVFILHLNQTIQKDNHRMCTTSICWPLCIYKCVRVSEDVCISFTLCFLSLQIQPDSVCYRIGLCFYNQSDDSVRLASCFSSPMFTLLP